MIASATATSAAAPAAFFAKWADMATWPEWNQDTEWVRLDGPFVQGATGTLKPKGGPKVGFVVEKLTDTEFVDVSNLLGARMTFAHTVSRAERTTVSVQVSIDGPLGWFWTRILGGDIAKSAQADLDALVAAAEAVRV
ncbi:SRPBCC family protein [Nocardia sp. NBC_01503]|uniref:SRPBCC family protein n=1 Tax=Nocardia sp. NBC_01503 TaxID=2975997 RepID=UPI002E7AF852|nr:SRPBCC family protein [Nocardia sp. NBC_01503]WTL36019.1 SRPBCC family protein [Nocardia sp. NBC_01503]